MFLIIEDELGLVSTMMHEAAGGLELLNTLESALNMLEKKSKKKKNLYYGPNLLLSKSWKVLHFQGSVLWLQKDKSPTPSRTHISRLQQQTFIQVDSRQNLATVPAAWARTEQSVNVVQPSGQRGKRTSSAFHQGQSLSCRCSLGSWFCLKVLFSFWCPLLDRGE